MADAKTALITGANKGLGLETARQLGLLGYTVLIGARDPEKGRAAAELLRREGVNATAVKLDVTSQADIDAVAQLIQEQFGGVLDVLVNNAGIMTEKSWTNNATSEEKLEDVRSTYEANVFAPFAVTKALLPALKKSDAGRIVNVSSILGSISLQATKGSPTYSTKLFAYNSSKAALNMFTIHLAHELRGTKIKVNSAHPGWVKTDMGGSAAPMDPADGAKTIVDLATAGDEGPTGSYVHAGTEIPW
ncbi:MAG TPA: SDR family oxidoreductase [Acidobacteriaceae bacterium]|nr:SDR family oxidoreductase [Acidobacteriaceae bacterium]